MPTHKPTPTSLRALNRDLANRPGRLLLLVGEDREVLAHAVAAAWGTQIDSAAERYVALGTSVVDPRQLINDAGVVADLDVLFWEPTYHLEIQTFLRGVARSRPVAFVWPGEIDGTTARYSEPGRRDFYEAELEDAIVLRARHGTFGDEPVYTMETVGA